MNNNEEQIIASTCLLLSVSNADGNIDKREIDIIKEIVIDYFSIDSLVAENCIIKSKTIFEQSTDIYEFGRTLNNSFSYQDKIDFIKCTFEVAFIDKDMHYLEEHTIKKISSILNVEQVDLINSKKEMKKYLEL